MITVQLGHEGQFRYFNFLLDSGADYSMISEGDALMLGLSYSSIQSNELKVELANTNHILAKKITLDLLMDGLLLQVPILVTKENLNCILGRQGVFEAFEITFKERVGKVVFNQV